jgi:hypothetical protein
MLSLPWRSSSSGSEKFLFPTDWGMGRFTHIGISYSGMMAPMEAEARTDYAMFMGLLFLLAEAFSSAATPLA